MRRYFSSSSSEFPSNEMLMPARQRASARLWALAGGVGLGLCVACGGASSDDGDDVEDPTLEAIDDADSWAHAEALRRGAFVVPSDIPVFGRSITGWTKEFFKWHFAVPADVSPILNLEQDCGTEQDDPVFFVPNYDGSPNYERSCRLSVRKPALIRVWSVINDYPCPDPAFQPAPGQSLEDFLRQGAVDYDNGVTQLTVTVDGKTIDLGDHRHTTRLFHFVGDPSLVGKLPDPCLLGGVAQPAVADGWWLMLLLAPGKHVVHVTGVTPEGASFDQTFKLKVTF